MKVGDRVMFANIALAETNGIGQDAVGTIVNIHKHPVIPDRLDVKFPGAATLLSFSEGDFVEVNSVG